MGAPPSDPKSSRLLIVDGHAYAYRAFHAIRQLSSPTGEPTNAIYGFIKMLGKMQTQLAPTHQAVIWDGGLSPERMAELPGYKEQRAPMPDDLEKQIEGLAAWLDASRISSWSAEGVEADDWIAALARLAANADMSVVIASSDKDFLQLVSPRIGLLNPNDKSEKIWTADDVRAKAGVGPGQIVDWLSLIGDAVDNIPGVPGVGPRTAADLLQQFGSVDALYERLSELKSEKQRASLQASMEAVRRNQRLIRLKEEMPLPFSLETIVVRPPDLACLQPLYAQWGFKTLLAQVSQPPPDQGVLL